MYKLKLLIVCLLVGFKSISQIDIKENNGFVILTETQARAVATDLVHYDFAKQIINGQELRLKNYQTKEVEFINKLSIKDSIIFQQKSIIDIQKEIVNNKKTIQIHGYIGVQSIQFNLTPPMLYANIMLEIYKINIGARYYIQPNNTNGYGIIIEYKLF